MTWIKDVLVWAWRMMTEVTGRPACRDFMRRADMGNAVIEMNIGTMSDTALVRVEVIVKGKKSPAVSEELRKVIMEWIHDEAFFADGSFSEKLGDTIDAACKVKSRTK